MIKEEYFLRFVLSYIKPMTQDSGSIIISAEGEAVVVFKGYGVKEGVG